MKQVPLDMMSPQEYLEHFQHEYYGTQLPPFAADVGDVLTASLIASLPDEHRKQLERVAIGVLPTKDVNAWAIRVPSGGEVIGFNFGTMSFLFALNKVLLCRVHILGFEPKLDFDVAAKLAGSIVRSFHSSDALPRWTVPPRHMLVASSLSNIQTSFVVGHELGHFLLGHLNSQVKNKTEVTYIHEMEYAADARGGELAIASFKRTHDPLFGMGDSALAQAGVDLFFTYMIFMEKLLNVSMSPHTSSHPSSADRRARLRERFWQDMPEQAQALASVAEKMFDAFAELLKSDQQASVLLPEMAQEPPTNVPTINKAKHKGKQKKQRGKSIKQTQAQSKNRTSNSRK